MGVGHALTCVAKPSPRLPPRLLLFPKIVGVAHFAWSTRVTSCFPLSSDRSNSRRLFGPWDAFDACGVRHDPDSLSLVGSPHGVSSDNIPLRIVPALGKASENVEQASAKES